MTNKLLLQEAEHYTKYYSQLIGATIDGVEMVIQDTGYSEEVWPTFHVTLKNGEKLTLELSQDPEGNGPGFLFGLYNV